MLQVPLLFACAGGPAAQPSPAATPFIPSESELKAGKVVHGPDATAYLLIRRGTPDVWQRLSDIPHWPAIFGDPESVTQVARAGGATAYAMVARTPLGKKRYTLAFSQPAQHRLEFVLDKTQPADVADASGFWELRPSDGGATTIVVYRGSYETSFPLPQFLRRRMAESMLTDLRTYFDRHPAPSVLVGKSATR